MNRDATVITTKIPHHSSHSGYEQLVKYLPKADIKFFERGHAKNIMSRIVERGLRFFSISRWYQWDGVLVDQLLLNVRTNENKVVHLLYGDSTVGVIPRYSKKCRIILTIHACPSDFKEVIQKPKELKKIDHFIILGENQRAFLNDIGIDNHKISFIPHGVDIEFFKPAGKKSRNQMKRVLLVGNWNRKFELYREVAQELEGSKIIFDVVTAEHNFHHFNGLTNVELNTGISDAELLEKYQSSDVLLMALHDAVANNVLLEAAACKLPIITEKVGAVEDYFSDDELIFVEPNDSDAIISILKDLNMLEVNFEEKSEKAFKQVQKYDWNHIAQLTSELYA